MKQLRRVFMGQLRNSRGITFVLVLIMIVVLSVLAVSIIGVTATNLKLSTGDRNEQAAYYIAEAAVPVKLEEVKTNILAEYEVADDPTIFFNRLSQQFRLNDRLPVENVNFSESFGITPEAFVTVQLDEEVDDETRRYKIISEGRVNNRVRTVEKSITVEWIDKTENDNSGEQPVSPYAVFTQGNLEIGNVTIDGAVASVSNNVNAHNNATITKGVIDNPPNINFNFSAFPTEFPYSRRSGLINSRTIESNGYYGSLSTHSINKIVGDRKIVVSNFIVDGDIAFDADSSLTIYVEDELSIDSDFNRSGNDVTIFYRGDRDININGGEFTGALYIRSADIILRGNPELKSTFIYAPNSFVDFGGNSSFSGSIVADRANIDGSASIYQEFFQHELTPFYPDPEGSNSTPTVTINDLLTETTPIKER